MILPQARALLGRPWLERGSQDVRVVRVNRLVDRLAVAEQKRRVKSMIGVEVDCFACRNENIECDFCEHNEELELEDNFDPLSGAELQKKKEEILAKREASLAKEVLNIDLPESFREAFVLAKKFTSQDDPYEDRCLAVYVTQESLIATNSHLFCRVFCKETPPELVGKYVINLNNGIAIGEGKPFDYGSQLDKYDADLNCQDYAVINLEEVCIKECCGPIKECALLSETVAIQRKYYDKAMAETGEKVCVKVSTKGDEKQPVIFEAEEIKVLVLPVRMNALHFV